ncbi:MAG: hypothetical protein K0V04_28545, partial [Deltaproteobacteria bacterium]|nr:hypothetical protein [Deltaproteobacteria bacterium]
EGSGSTDGADSTGAADSTESTDGADSTGGSETGEPGEPQLEVLVQGAAIVGGANGMFFDAKDRLYVANVGGQSISVLNPETGDILDMLGPDVGVVFPDDLTFSPDGTLYWTDFGQGQVFGASPDGTVQSVAAGIPSVNPITVSDDGRLFVAQCFDPVSNGIYELDPAGVEPPRLILGDVLGCASNGMDWRDGYLYSPQWFNGRVVRVDVETGDLTEVTTNWPVPAAVKFDSAGQLHAVSYGSGEVVRIDVETGARTVLAQLPIGLDNLAFDSSDRLFVSSATDSFVVEVQDDGSTSDVSSGGMNLPMGLALLGDQLWVGEGLSLRSFDKDGGEPLEVVRNILGIGPFMSSPGNVTALDTERLLLLDPFSGGAAIFDTTTGMVELIESFVTPGDSEVFGGGVAVTEIGTGRIVLATGPTLAERQTLVEGLTAPTGLAADGDDLYVSDVATGMVLQVVSGGETLAAPVSVTEAAVAQPEGMTVRSGGRLVVVEGGAGALREIDLSSGDVTTLATDLSFLAPLPGLLPFQFLNDVVVDDDDVLYINGDADAVIYSLIPADAD